MARRRMLQGGTYLEVRPEEMQWITIWNPIDYTIRSNTRWNIK